MICFNLLPIYPLDGYRIINNLFVNFKYRYLIRQIIFLSSLIVCMISIIFSLIFKLYGVIIIFLVLVYLNVVNYIKVQKEEKIKHLVVLYHLNNLKNDEIIANRF